MDGFAPPVADLADITARLKQAAPGLRALGVEAVTIFGSFAEGVQTDFSDVDLVVEPRPATFGGLLDVEDALGDLFMRDVDVLTPGAVEPYLRDQIERVGRRIPL
ncbi:MAG: nucleotidyltransferase domain-containing protein [Oceanicaulis sp.]|nr:nucleotidyltransferase domain-containing protein [Oceanicaulis sp.]